MVAPATPGLADPPASTLTVRLSVPGTSLEEVAERPVSSLSTDNQPPTAIFKVGPAPIDGQLQGGSPFEVTFNVCRSEDPEGDRLLFTMDSDGDGRNDESGTHGGNCRRTFTYEAERGEVQTWNPSICVTDLDSAGQPAHASQCRTYSVTAYGRPAPQPPGCAFTTQASSTWVGTLDGFSAMCTCPVNGAVIPWNPNFVAGCSANGFIGSMWQNGGSCSCF
jgi:hypothetical protein